MDECFVSDWNAMFAGDPEVTQPVISVPMDVFNVQRDAIVKAARANGFMRVLFLKDQANAHFCRYV
jgi:molecular chaperone DnaK (HSP70)